MLLVAALLASSALAQTNPYDPSSSPSQPHPESQPQGLERPPKKEAPKEPSRWSLGVEAAGGVWLLEAPYFDVELKGQLRLFSWLYLGVRPGVAVLFQEPNTRLAVPLDATLKVKLFIFFFEAIGGAWFIPSHRDVVRPHLAGQLGLEIWRFTFGAEVSYLAPSITISGRVGIRIF
ncbi:MAG: hypothetical protein DI536_12195 [Archangium gephyra]|uniref:DUF3996 domain-containing protein n=1 Tax=Archangium gephyra TaxID=48 RepID=A0A2W5VC27_9BACT|nr:MAG: hypothetical protein DI536_12195 [Archangium gephyra]